VSVVGGCNFCGPQPFQTHATAQQHCPSCGLCSPVMVCCGRIVTNRSSPEPYSRLPLGERLAQLAEQPCNRASMPETRRRPHSENVRMSGVASKSCFILTGMIRRRSICWREGMIGIFGLVVATMISAEISPAQTAQTTSPGQIAPAPAAAPVDPVTDLVNRMAPPQKMQFANAVGAFKSQHYPEALATFKLLLNQFPGDDILFEFATEAALNSGDTAFALQTIRPVAAVRPDEFHATALLTRACSESGDTSCRDAGMARIVDLHRRGLTPQRMKDYVVEHVKVRGNTLVIYVSFEPSGYYKVYDYGEVVDGQGKLFLSITVESNDGDQPGFAREYPKEAGAGLRRFSLDAYREMGLNSQGQRTQTHYTYEFFVGQPSYDKVREAFINVVNEKSKPISSRTGLTIP